ncbi:MAG: TIGR01440 family protein [Clostridia bacterium]|nr:TIGR01440 family protein [Clostridia bacterium]
MDLNEIKTQAAATTEELVIRAGLKKGQTVVVGCSTSEVLGSRIGSDSSPEAAAALVEGILSVLEPRGIYLAAQCCEHLNRAIVTVPAAVPFTQRVNVVPQPKAGGSFASEYYKRLPDPVVVEEIKADAGMDIGFTLIGMHLRAVAVPLRLENDAIGEAKVLAARTRPKFIGGVRAVYDENML